MQTLVQVFCRGNLTSLRREISIDKRIEKYNLFVLEHKKSGRSGGWLKLRCEGADGVINIEWDSNTKLLYARVINKGETKPDFAIGAFVSYMLGRHKAVIKAINIVPIR